MTENILKSSIPYRGPVSENLIEFVQKGLEKNLKQTLLVDSASDRSWTGQEIRAAVGRIARYLIDTCRVEKGDVCSIYGKPDDHAVLLILSVIVSGGVSIFLTNKYRAREVLDTAKTTNSKFLISSSELLKEVEPTLKELGDKIQLIPYDPFDKFDGHNQCSPTTLGALFLKDCISEGYTFAELIRRADINIEQDFAVIQFSSGTTGKPKPIPRTHKNLCHLVASVDHGELMDLKPGEVITGSLPITHRPGLWALLACINGGSKLVLWSNLSDVQDALKTIEKYKVTIFSSSLPFLAMLGNVGVKIKHQYDLSSFKHIITSGAKIVHPDLPKTVVNEFGLKSLRQCFGMTECGWVFLIESLLAKDNYLSVGHVCPGMEAIIVEKNSSEPLGVGIKKEIALRGPQIFPGYLTSTKGVFNRSDFTADGWFKTGDQGYYDEQQLVYIEGRYKELLLFKNSGRFFPNEIEYVISEHPSIEGACVVKVGEFKGSYTYDIARAYVTLKQGCNLTEKELLDFVSERAFEIELEGGVRILDRFPRLENGKIDKQTLKDIK